MYMQIYSRILVDLLVKLTTSGRFASKTRLGGCHGAWAPGMDTVDGNRAPLWGLAGQLSLKLVDPATKVQAHEGVPRPNGPPWGGEMHSREARGGRYSPPIP